MTNSIKVKQVRADSGYSQQHCHQEHEVARRKDLQISPFVSLRVLCGLWFFSSNVGLSATRAPGLVFFL